MKTHTFYIADYNPKTLWDIVYLQYLFYQPSTEAQNDEFNEILKTYQSIDVDHDNFRIYDDGNALNNFFLNTSMTGHGIDDAIREFIFIIAPNNFKQEIHWELKGDGDGLGFIVDIWDATFDECLHTATFWFEDFVE